MRPTFPTFAHLVHGTRKKRKQRARAEAEAAAAEAARLAAKVPGSRGIPRRTPFPTLMVARLSEGLGQRLRGSSRAESLAARREERLDQYDTLG